MKSDIDRARGDAYPPGSGPASMLDVRRTRARPRVEDALRERVDLPAVEIAGETPQAYARPVTFLLAASRPLLTGTAVSCASASESRRLRASLSHTARRAAELNGLMRTQVASVAEINLGLARLETAASRAHDGLADELQRLVRTHGRDKSTTALKRALARDSGTQLRGYVIYDTYFNIFRVPAVTGRQLASQVGSTCLNLLGDLPFTTLGVDQLLGLTSAIQVMYEQLARNVATDTSIRPPRAAARVDTRGDHRRAWADRRTRSGEDGGRWTVKVAFYRWYTGHHFFNLCSDFCREHLDQACTELEAGDESSAANAVHAATTFLRGATAAMNYAANFPSATYASHIRPSMIMTETPHGFSGSQNLDYNHLRAAKKRFLQTLFNGYGADARTWPELVYDAARRFQQADVEDSEHHVLIAASKVGTDSSLSQKIWQARLPAGAPVKNAVDMLRDMAEMKRREYKL